MVTNQRRRAIFTALSLYGLAVLFISYFAINAFTGERGLRAQQDLDQQMVEMKTELARLKDERAIWERRVALLRADRLDPDMLEERARALLDDVDPRDVTLLLNPR
ncbi:MAG: septum formation initiator family protein [Pseudolabrys sp.]|nr:septum formation initiator family protein [Pseudolabrys sp.]MBV9260050.1 septum formation initiator family protein [Pseudolabrys sp.]